MLVGRAAMVERIGATLDRACRAHADGLCLTGDPGLGRTALLDCAEGLATDRGMSVVRVTAMEPESGIPNASLALLLARLGQQRDDAPSPEALLAALTHRGSDGPLAVLVDDAHWLDPRSQRLLAFAFRRLLADPVALIATCRRDPAGPWLDALPQVGIEPLGIDDSMLLLAELAPDMPTHVAREVARDLAGVPLALVGIRDLLTADERTGRAPLPRPVPVGEAVQRRYAAGFQSLTASQQRALVVLAADDTGDPTVLVAAMGGADASWQDLLAAEERGLIRLNPVARFTHPLARSAVYAAVQPGWWRSAHGLLGAVLTTRDDPRALRHRALATVGADDDLAADLEAAARRWADSPDEATMLALHAADRSSQATDRERRLLLAAELTADPGRSAELARDVMRTSRDPDNRARAAIVLADTAATPAPTSLLGSLLEFSAGSALAPQVMSHLIWSAMDVCDLDQVRQLAGRIAEQPAPSWLLIAALGSARMYLGEGALGVATLRAARRASDAVEAAALSTDNLVDWAIIPAWLGDDQDEVRFRFRLMDRVLHARGRPLDLIVADFFGAERMREEGGWDRAVALFTHAVDLLADLGQPTPVHQTRLASVYAARGDEAACRALLSHARRGFAATPSPWLERWIPALRGLLHLTLARPQDAVTALTPIRRDPLLGRGARDSSAFGLVDLVEAHVALGQRSSAAAVTEELATLLAGLVDPVASALVNRCRALVTVADADELLTAALTELDGASEEFELARTELLLGEHLRRTRRPRQSRTHLGAAHEAFEYLGARPWAERAHRELRASGQQVTVPAGTVSDTEALTPQELRVALEVAHGLSNTQVAGALFVSAKTVEFHLSKVYRKLGVRSRGGLSQALGARGLLDAGGSIG